MLATTQSQFVSTTACSNVTGGHSFIGGHHRFHATGLFWYPMKTSENQRFSDVFMGYRKRPVA